MLLEKFAPKILRIFRGNSGFDENLWEKNFFNNKLEKSSLVLFKWFNDNYTNVHGDKSQFLISENKKGIINIDNDSMKTEDVHELLGLTNEPKLTFENRIDKLYKEVSQKLYALAKISDYNKRKVLIKAFIKSQLLISFSHNFLI